MEQENYELDLQEQQKHQFQTNHNIEFDTDDSLKSETEEYFNISECKKFIFITKEELNNDSNTSVIMFDSILLEYQYPGNSVAYLYNNFPDHPHHFFLYVNGTDYYAFDKYFMPCELFEVISFKRYIEN